MPPTIDVLTPSHIAAILGWDEQDVVRVVPMTDEEATAAVMPTRVGTGERRLRNVV